MTVNDGEKQKDPSGGQNTSNQISATSFEEENNNKNNNSGSVNNRRRGSKGLILLDNLRNDHNPAPMPFENSDNSIKIEDIDFYKLSMIAGGGID